MEELSLIIQSVLTTLCSVSLFLVSKKTKGIESQTEKADKLVRDLAEVNNTNAETMKNIIAKIQDLETRLAMERKSRFNNL